VSNWRRRRTAAEPTVEIIHDKYRPFHRVQALAHRGITLTIVDTAGGWSDACTGAIAAADLCLIPTRPSPADIDAAAPMLSAVRESGKPFAFVLNLGPQHPPERCGRLSRQTRDRAEDVACAGATRNRAAQRTAGRARLGLGVTEYTPRGKSAEETHGLWQWICARLSCASQLGAEAPAHAHARPLRGDAGQRLWPAPARRAP